MGRAKREIIGGKLEEGDTQDNMPLGGFWECVQEYLEVHRTLE